jgi:type I restriction enzyme S subunit
MSATQRLRVRANQFIISRIDARNGASALVPDHLDGAVVSNDFPAFVPDAARLDVNFLGWLSRTKTFVELCKAASEGTTNRVRLKEDHFLATEIPLPPLAEQRRLVGRIDALAARVEEVNAEASSIESKGEALLSVVFHRMTTGATVKRLGDIAPLTRRPAKVDPLSEYPQVSVRSFGRGTFHNPPLQGSDITWEKPHLVLAGDILVSNIKAWEGAIAVARAEDDRRYGSHRYLTYVPVANEVTGRFLCYYLLTPEGLHYTIADGEPANTISP